MYWYLQQLLRPKIYILCLQRSLWQRLLVFRILCLRQQLAWQRNLYTLLRYLQQLPHLQDQHLPSAHHAVCGVLCNIAIWDC